MHARRDGNISRLSASSMLRKRLPGLTSRLEPDSEGSGSALSSGGLTSRRHGYPLAKEDQDSVQYAPTSFTTSNLSRIRYDRLPSELANASSPSTPQTSEMGVGGAMGPLSLPPVLVKDDGFGGEYTRLIFSHLSNSTPESQGKDTMTLVDGAGPLDSWEGEGFITDHQAIRILDSLPNASGVATGMKEADEPGRPSVVPMPLLSASHAQHRSPNTTTTARQVAHPPAPLPHLSPGSSVAPFSDEVAGSHRSASSIGSHAAHASLLRESEPTLNSILGRADRAAMVLSVPRTTDVANSFGGSLPFPSTATGTGTSVAGVSPRLLLTGSLTPARDGDTNSATMNELRETLRSVQQLDQKEGSESPAKEVQKDAGSLRAVILMDGNVNIDEEKWSQGGGLLQHSSSVGTSVPEGDSFYIGTRKSGRKRRGAETAANHTSMAPQRVRDALSRLYATNSPSLHTGADMAQPSSGLIQGRPAPGKEPETTRLNADASTVVMADKSGPLSSEGAVPPPSRSFTHPTSLRLPLGVDQLTIAAIERRYGPPATPAQEESIAFSSFSRVSISHSIFEREIGDAADAIRAVLRSGGVAGAAINDETRRLEQQRVYASHLYTPDTVIAAYLANESHPTTTATGVLSSSKGAPATTASSGAVVAALSSIARAAPSPTLASQTQSADVPAAAAVLQRAIKDRDVLLRGCVQVFPKQEQLLHRVRQWCDRSRVFLILSNGVCVEQAEAAPSLRALARLAKETAGAADGATPAEEEAKDGVVSPSVPTYRYMNDPIAAHEEVMQRVALEEVEVQRQNTLQRSRQRRASSAVSNDASSMDAQFLYGGSHGGSWPDSRVPSITPSATSESVPWKASQGTLAKHADLCRKFDTWGEDLDLVETENGSSRTSVAASPLTPSRPLLGWNSTKRRSSITSASSWTRRVSNETAAAAAAAGTKSKLNATERDLLTFLLTCTDGRSVEALDPKPTQGSCAWAVQRLLQAMENGGELGDAGEDSIASRSTRSFHSRVTAAPFSTGSLAVDVLEGFDATDLAGLKKLHSQLSSEDAPPTIQLDGQDAGVRYNSCGPSILPMVLWYECPFATAEDRSSLVSGSLPPPLPKIDAQPHGAPSRGGGKGGKGAAVGEHAGWEAVAVDLADLLLCFAATPAFRDLVMEWKRNRTRRWEQVIDESRPTVLHHWKTVVADFFLYKGVPPTSPAARSQLSHRGIAPNGFLARGSGDNRAALGQAPILRSFACNVEAFLGSSQWRMMTLHRVVLQGVQLGAEAASGDEAPLPSNVSLGATKATTPEFPRVGDTLYIPGDGARTCYPLDMHNLFIFSALATDEVRNHIKPQLQRLRSQYAELVDAIPPPPKSAESPRANLYRSSGVGTPQRRLRGNIREGNSAEDTQLSSPLRMKPPTASLVAALRQWVSLHQVLEIEAAYIQQLRLLLEHEQVVRSFNQHVPSYNVFHAAEQHAWGPLYRSALRVAYFVCEELQEKGMEQLPVELLAFLPVVAAFTGCVGGHRELRSKLSETMLDLVERAKKVQVPLESLSWKGMRQTVLTEAIEASQLATRQAAAVVSCLVTELDVIGLPLTRVASPPLLFEDTVSLAE